MPRILLLLFVLISLSATSQTKDSAVIVKILQVQQDAWNKADLDAFMIGYWKNDRLKFIGKSGITYGWQATLDNYKKSYKNADEMGKLQFTILTVEPIAPGYYNVVGKWHLTRIIGNLEGHFSLLFRKINGQWRIVQDHSS